MIWEALDMINILDCQTKQYMCPPVQMDVGIWYETCTDALSIHIGRHGQQASAGEAMA